MPYLLNLIYLALLIVLSPWLLYCAIRKGKYRQGLRCKLLGHAPVRSGNRFCVWLHAVSVGEVNLLEPLLREIEREHPDWECFISTTTQTGYELAKRKYATRTVFYCPLDFSWAVKRALANVRPDLLILAELELWPNLIRFAQSSGAKVAVVNGRLSEKSARGYGRLRSLVKGLLNRIDLIAVQNEEYGQRFLQLGALPRSVQETGSIKFDGAEIQRDNPRTKTLATTVGLSEKDSVFLVGSTQSPEEQLAVESFLVARESTPDLKLIVVPRHPERFEEVARLLDNSPVTWLRRSAIPEAEGTTGDWDVLLVDVVGELGAWWGTADVGFVGGSMGTRGGQNMIEPAGYGVATCFGPKTSNFRDVVALLLASNAARVVHDGRELTDFLLNCLRDAEYRRQIGDRAQSLVKRQQGATLRTLNLLQELVKRESETPENTAKDGRQQRIDGPEQGAPPHSSRPTKPSHKTAE